MNEIATCPFCQFSKQEWREGRGIYSYDWNDYAPVETTVLGHASIECKNCGIVVTDINRGCLVDAWNILSAQALR